MDRSANAVNALIHLYRAEVGRLVAYRTRLDTTTNWAVTTSAIVITTVLANAQVTHAAFLFLMLLTTFFLHLEARRFCYYELVHDRVQMLERSFYPEVLGRETDPGWTEPLLRSLARPVAPVSGLNALGWRLRRNYIWIYLVVLLAWLGKLGIAREPAVGLGDLVAHASVGLVPGWLVWVVVGAGYLCLIGLSIRAGLSHPLAEE